MTQAPNSSVAAAATAASAEPKSLTRLAPTERLVSLDALRGFDMFWIVGAEAIVKGLEKLGENSALDFVTTQLKHKTWEGIAFEDLIFPLFVFLSGVSMVFSLTKSLAQNGRAATLKKLFFRAVLLYLLGVFMYGALANTWDKIRWLGVLQRIALSYFFAGLVFCFFDLRGRIAVLLTLLIGYWAAMSFVPVPGVGAGNFAEKMNLANYVDARYLPGFKWDGDHDPEGLLSTLPAIASCLLGVLAGMFLKSERYTPLKRAGGLVLGGLILICLGYAWSFQFPIVKKIWTSTFVLAAGGYAAIMLGAFYVIIDIWKFELWARPFVWIGTNALTIYIGVSLIKFGEIAKRFVGGDIADWLGKDKAPLVQALTTMLLIFLFARFLYKRKLFLRL